MAQSIEKTFILYGSKIRLIAIIIILIRKNIKIDGKFQFFSLFKDIIHISLLEFLLYILINIK